MLRLRTDRPRLGDGRFRERTLLNKPGLHIVALPREDWERMVDRLARVGSLLILSPDPVPVRLARVRRLQYYWFRSDGGGHSYPATATSLERMCGRFARPRFLTLVEGVQILLYWNGLQEVLDLLRALDRRLSLVGSVGLLHVLKETLRESELLEVTNSFIPASLEE